MRVLIDVANGRVGDELIDTLRRAGHVVERGSANISARRFDVIVVSSPDAAGRLTREHPSIPVLVFTRVGDVPARVHALEVGADDAFDASFAPSQVGARIGAAGRRAALMPREAERIVIDGCTIDLSASTASATAARAADRARGRHRALAGAHARAGGLARRAAPARVARAPRNETRAVDVAIAGAARQARARSGGPAIIVSVRGAGYRWG